MIDLTSQLHSFHAAAHLWSREAASRLATALATALDGELDWDDDAGEDWARIVRGSRVLALVSMLGPMVLVLEEVAGIASSVIEGDVASVVVTSMDAPAMKCEPEALRLAFGKRALSPALRPDCFSADDLWFATVS